MRDDDLLPSWRHTKTRAALLRFLATADTVPVSERVAAFDNDGTLWAERPTYAQLDFFMDALRAAVDVDPHRRDRAEYAALLEGQRAVIGESGLQRIAVALAELFVDLTPDAFAARVREFMARARHHTLEVPFRHTVYRPMLELLDELRRRHFAIFIVTGGGAEFVRAISQDLYGVSPEAVVGTQVAYEFGRDDDGRPLLRRTSRIAGRVNEGPAKVADMQTQIGRRPMLGVGNSGGDREMLEWTCAGAGARLALLVDHDDGDREFCYDGSAETVADPELVTATAERLGWTVISMRRDWATVFGAPHQQGAAQVPMETSSAARHGVR